MKHDIFIGYCQKYEGNQDFQLIHHGIDTESLERGKQELQIFKSDYTNNKRKVDPDNVLIVTYQYW